VYRAEGNDLFRLFVNQPGTFGPFCDKAITPVEEAITGHDALRHRGTGRDARSRQIWNKAGTFSIQSLYVENIRQAWAAPFAGV
jgi:hypothetical protein